MFVQLFFSNSFPPQQSDTRTEGFTGTEPITLDTKDTIWTLFLSKSSIMRNMISLGSKENHPEEFFHESTAERLLVGTTFMVGTSWEEIVCGSTVRKSEEIANVTNLSFLSFSSFLRLFH